MSEIEITQVGEGKYIATCSIGTISSGACDSPFEAALALVEEVRMTSYELAEKTIDLEDKTTKEQK